MEDHLKENGHVNAGMEMDEDCSTPASNNNRKIKPDFGNNKNTNHQAVVFEDLPYEPSAVMDKIEKFWITLALFCNTHQRIFKIVGLAVTALLYNCYFFGAVAYYIQYKVNKNYVTFMGPVILSKVLYKAGFWGTVFLCLWFLASEGPQKSNPKTASLKLFLALYTTVWF